MAIKFIRPSSIITNLKRQLERLEELEYKLDQDLLGTSFVADIDVAVDDLSTAIDEAEEKLDEIAEDKEEEEGEEESELEEEDEEDE